MSLDINALVATAFDIVEGVSSQLVEIVTYYYQSSNPTYTVATGLTGENLVAINNVRAIPTKISERELVNLDANPDLEIRASDRVYLIAHNKLGRRPLLGDKITLASGQNWAVVGLLSVPGGSLYKVVVRTP